MIGSLFAYRWLVMQFTHSTHIIQGPIQAVLSAHSQCGRNVTNWRRVEKVCRQRRRRSIPFTFQSNGDEVVFNSNNNNNGDAKRNVFSRIHHLVHPSCDYSCINPRNQSMGKVNYNLEPTHDPNTSLPNHDPPTYLLVAL